MDKQVESYLEMQRRYYAVDGNNDGAMNAIVGGYEAHEGYPYERYLLKHFEGREKPLGLAFDFGCGPGRMILRMSKYFDRVDGCDISTGMIHGCQRRTFHLPNRPLLYHIDGRNLSGVQPDTYDLVYCTISFHHICSYPVRLSLLTEFHRILKQGGRIALHMMYTDQPRGAWLHHVDWRESNHNAQATNGFHDVRVTPSNLHEVEEDLVKIGFKDFDHELGPMPWPHEATTAFIFIHAVKA